MNERKTAVPFLPVIALGAAVVALVELLSLGHMLTGGAILAFWMLAALIAARYTWSLRDRDGLRTRFMSLSRGERAAILVIAAVSAVNLFLALVAAPSARDALAYHAPRVLHWIQNRSAAHYPTHIDRQLWISPGAEFFTLQLQLLTGSDRLINLVQWLSSIGCLFTTAQIASILGAGRRGQLLTALFVATIPMAVAQASGAQTDLFASFWISASVVLLLGSIRSGRGISLFESIILGLCLGLAAFAKGTAYIVLAPFVVWFAIAMVKRMRARSALPALVAIAAALLVNAGHLSRNYGLYGNALTNPRNTSVTNDAITPGIIFSNAVRNLTLHTYTRSRAINDAMYKAVLGLHETLGLRLNDRRSTFYVIPYDIKARPRSEGNVGNHLHLLLIATAMGIVLWRRPDKQSVRYVLALVTGAILFCALIKWQVSSTRLQLPFFVLGGAVAGFVAERYFSRRGVFAFAGLLIIAAMPMLLRNTGRPLLSRDPIWTVPRERRYFMETPALYDAHRNAADFLANQNCGRVGLVTSWVDHELLLWAVMRHRVSAPVLIHHAFMQPGEASVSPPSRPYDPDACAIVSIYVASWVKPARSAITSEWRLAFEQGPVQVYLKTTTGTRSSLPSISGVRVASHPSS